MTAINVLQYREGVVVLTDAAQYLSDGTLLGKCSKVQLLPHCNAVMASRSPKLFLPLIADHVGTNADSFDGLIAGLALAVRTAYELHSQVLRLCDLGADFDLIIAGWSESRNRPETWCLFSHDRYGSQPWEPVEMGPVVLMPMDETLHASLALTEAQLAGNLDPLADGLRIMEGQRRVAAPQGDNAEPSHGVGGFAQLTMVTPAGIETRIVRRWPEDRIGEKLGRNLAA